MPKEQISDNKPDHDPVRRRLLQTMAFGALTLVVPPVLSACGEEKKGTPPPPTPEPTLSPEPTSESTAELDINEQARILYEKIVNFNNNYSTRRQEGTSEEDLKREAQNLTFEEIHLLDKYWGQANDFRTDGETHIVFTNSEHSRSFNLDDPTEFAISAALVHNDFLISFFPTEEEKKQSTPPGSQQRQEDIQTILWLGDNFQVETSHIPPWIDMSDLRNLCRILKTLKEAQIKMPQKIQFIAPYDNIDNPLDTLQIVTSASCTCANHLLYPAQRIGDFFVRNNPDTLEEYKNAVSQAYKWKASAITHPELLSTDHDGYAMEDDVELRINFLKYFLNGEAFRKRIAYCYAKDFRAEAEILKAKYDFLRNVFGNREYSINGQLKNVQTYKKGDVVEIDDYESPKNPGILLRQGPTLEKNFDWPTVKNLETIQVLGGPVTVIDEDNLEGIEMYKVVVGRVAQGREFVPDRKKRQGWISAEWLGENENSPQITPPSDPQKTILQSLAKSPQL